jgi:serine protease Do
MNNSMFRNVMRLSMGIVVLTSVLGVEMRTLLALPAPQISKAAKGFTVLINSQSPGSGVIVQKQGKTYTVLTAAHVVEYPDYEYTIHAPDQQTYKLDYKTVKKLPGLDLAIVEFTSDRPYQIAPIANSDDATEGADIYIAGFPDPGTATQERIFQFTSGEVSSRPTQGPKGYLMHYTNVTRVGMSGGPILNSDAKLVGIHGLANTDQDSGSKTGINLGIPINSFLSTAPKVGFSLKAATPTASVPTVPNPGVANTPQIPVPSTIPSLVPSSSPSLIPTRPKPIRPGSGGGSPVCAGISC